MPTPEQIEKAARAAFGADWPKDDWTRFGTNDYVPNRYRRIVVAALSAAEGVKPRVKPLHWVPSSGGKWLRAESISGVYEVRQNDPRRAEIQANFQARHDAKIRSALQDGE